MCVMECSDEAVVEALAPAQAGGSNFTLGLLRAEGAIQVLSKLEIEKSTFPLYLPLSNLMCNRAFCLYRCQWDMFMPCSTWRQPLQSVTITVPPTGYNASYQIYNCALLTVPCDCTFRCLSCPRARKRASKRCST